jgi:hypothetical protein
MTPTSRRWTGIAAAGGVLTFVIAQTPSSWADEQTRLPGSLYAPSVLVLTFAAGEEPEPVQRAVSLRCMPPGGDHPAPAAACRDLEEAGGDFARLPVSRDPCTFEYRPVTVTARGVWRGSMRSYSATFPNRCVMIRRTGSVFPF